jgi:hypothetical protein
MTGARSRCEVPLAEVHLGDVHLGDVHLGDVHLGDVHLGDRLTGSLPATTGLLLPCLLPRWCRDMVWANLLRRDEGRLLHSTPLYSTYNTPLLSTSLHSTPHHSTPLHSTPLHSTPLHSTPLYPTALHSTPLYSTPLHSIKHPRQEVSGIIAKPFGIEAKCICGIIAVTRVSDLSEKKYAAQIAQHRPALSILSIRAKKSLELSRSSLELSPNVSVGSSQ